jgi:hydroxymethylbilane synthase
VPQGLHIAVVERILPAPGQGAIAVECRKSDSLAAEILHALHDETTAQCVSAERNFLRAQGGGCHVAIAARAVIEDGRLILRTFPPS